MQTINLNQVSPALKSLFDPSIPTVIRCLAVLEGGNSGKIVTNDVDHPRWAFVWEKDDGTLYRGGNWDKQILANVISTFRQEGVVALGFREGDPTVDLFPPDPDAGAECLELNRPLGSNDLSQNLDHIPDGYQIQRMNRQLLESSSHCEATVNRYGSIENFLAKGIAVCLLRGSEIVSEAYADMDVGGVRELGIRTTKPYEGHGFATLACAHLIRLCEDSGSATFWDCSRFNLGSRGVARKLGFGNERAYKLLAWFPPRDAVGET